MVLVMAMQEGWNAVRWWLKTLKIKLNLKGNYQAQVQRPGGSRGSQAGRLDRVNGGKDTLGRVRK
jgi:hypothetical protein